MFKYLKDESYYNDLYDLGTIESCLSSLERWQKLINEKFNTNDLKKLSEEDRMKGFRYYAKIELHTIKGGRFRRRKSIIKEWMDRDRKRDERLKNAQEPKNIHCADCSTQMKVTLKDLYDFTEDASRVLFFFECERCNKRKGIFDDGKEFVSPLGSRHEIEALSLSFLLAFSSRKMNTGEVVSYELRSIRVSFMTVGEPVALIYKKKFHL